MDTALERARTAELPAFWLRDNCACAVCRDPRNGQKLFGIGDLPSDLTVDRVVESAGTVTVTFGPDGHTSEFASDWFAEDDLDTGGDGRSERGKQVWTAADLSRPSGRIAATYSWSDYVADDATRLQALRAIRGLGFALLRNCPVVERTVLDIAETFGYVRTTNYGDLFDVRVEPNPTNLAFTGMAIAPHTDNPYRDPVPTLQLLHCLDNSVDGGESGLVDGFAAASRLRDESPDAFDRLIRTVATFEWSDPTASLRADRPLIGVDPSGNIREVRFNNRSMRSVHAPLDELGAFYDAYRTFAEIVMRPEMMLTFRLDAGDCVIFDNTRLLHARTGFADAGSRHLQGCYADLDGLLSTLAVLEAATADRS